MKTTFIKLDRSITDWQWYTDGNTMRVFIHLMLKANIRKSGFAGTVLQPGEAAISYSKIADSLNLSIQQVRTAIEHLKSTGEIAVRKHRNITVYKIINFESYQGSKQSENISSTAGQQHPNNIRNKEYLINIYNGCNDENEKTRLKEAFEEYCEMRKQIGRPLGDLGAERIVERLNSLARSPAEKITMLKTATERKWMTVYPLQTPLNKTSITSCSATDNGSFFSDAHEMMYDDNDRE